MIKIFDIKNNKVIINEHILLLSPLSELYHLPNGIKYISLCYYLTNPYEDENPFIYFNDKIKETKIREYLGIKSIPNDVKPKIDRCITFLNEIYITPTVRLFNALKKKIDDIAEYLDNTIITDKNIKDVRDTIKAYNDIIQPYKTALQDIINERKNIDKEQINIAYDQ